MGRAGFLLFLRLSFLTAFSLSPATALRPEAAACSSPGTAPGQRERNDEAQTGVGVREAPRQDGGKDVIHESATLPEEEAKARREEKDKEEKSWEILRGLIIDRRSR